MCKNPRYSVTIDANVHNFGTNRNMNYMHLLKIQENV
jgi:hypothetical protein